MRLPQPISETSKAKVRDSQKQFRPWRWESLDSNSRQLNNQSLWKATHRGSGRSSSGTAINACLLEAPSRRGVSPAVGTGQVGHSRVRLPTAQKLPCPTREMARELCGLIVFTKPPHLLLFSLCGHYECSLQLGCYFLSSQFLSLF